MTMEVLDTPVAAPAEAPAAPSLRDTLAAAVEANPITAPAPDRETRQQSDNNAADAAQRLRDAQGRFQPKQQADAAKARDGAEVPSAKEVQQANEPQADQNEEQPQQAEVAPNIDNAPRSWKAGPKAAWSSLPPEVRTEVHRREREATRAISESAPVRKFTQDFTQVIQPHAQRYANSGMTPLQVIHNLMGADAILSQAPMAQRAQFMAKLISDYGIDVAMLDSALAGEDPNTEPTAKLESIIDRKLQPLQQFVEQTTQQRQAAVQREYQSQEQVIQGMMDDETNFPHMAVVALDMADIMEMNSRRKVYLSPQEAYKRAVAMNPEAQAAEQGAAGQQRARVAHDAATRSLGASLSVSGSPAGLKQQVAPSDLRGTIEAAWAAAQGR
jgi:hypothetical protein